MEVVVEEATVEKAILDSPVEVSDEDKFVTAVAVVVPLGLFVVTLSAVVNSCVGV